MNKIEQARRSIETAMARIGCPPGDNADADLYRDLQRSLAILKDMEGQEPVAWMYKGGDSRYPAYLTLEKDIAEEDADDPSSIIPLYAHPSPSAPVDIAEIIKAGDVMHEAMVRYQMDVDDDPPMKHRDMMEAWTEATAKHRTT